MSRQPLRAAYEPRQIALLGAAFLLAALTLSAWTVAVYEIGIATALAAAVALAVVVVILYAPMAGVCLAVLSAPLEYLALGPSGASFSITPSEGILLATAASVAPRLLGTITAARIPTALYAFGGLILISVFGTFIAIDTVTVLRIVLGWLAFGLIALFISQRPAKDLRAIAISLALSGGILGTMALGNLSNQESFSGGAIVANRADANFAHPTALAHFLILTFPLAFALGLRGPVNWRWPMFSCGVLGLLGLMLTQTRGSIIGASIALVWMMVSWAPFRRLALASLGLIAIVAAFNPGSVTNSQPVTVVGDRLGALSLDSTGNDRLQIWSTTPDIVASNPFLGVGQGNFPIVSPHYGLLDVGSLPFDHAHNLFLNVAAELGLIGLALLLFFLGAVAAAARRALAHSEESLYPIAVALSASLLAILINSLTEYPLRQNLILATIMIDIGLLLGIERLMRQSPDHANRPTEPGLKVRSA